MARPRGIKARHPLGSVPTRSGVSQLTVVPAASSATASGTGVKISELPAADAANDTDQFEVNQTGTSRRVTLDQMAALVGTVTLADDIYSYGADGAGGATDLAALDAMLATQIEDLPRLHVWAKTSIDVGSLIPGSDTVDPMPYLQKIFTAFDTPGLQGRHFIFGRQRAWKFLARPSTGLGPQSQYLTPPQRCTLEWQREWDFSAYPASTAPTFLRREASYGPTIAVVGSLVKGARTITVASGGAAGLVYGQRLVLRATTLLDTLTGAWTLSDNTPASGASARAEDLIVKSVAGDVITFENYLQDNYPSTTTPVLQTYLNEPEIRLVNPTAIGPGWNGGAQSDRFIDIRRGRNFIVEGGRITNFAQALRVNGNMGGSISDLQVFGIAEGIAGGGLTLNDGCSDMVIENCTSWGGSQMFMLSSQSDAYGIMRDVTFRDCTANGPLNGFSTHNTHERITWNNCRVNNSTGAAFDVRVPNCTLTNCSAFNVNLGIILRPSANNTVIDGFRIDKALSGITFQDDATEVDYNPSNITVRNCLLERIGGTGSQGALRFDYPNNTAGVFPVLGPLNLVNNTITMTNNTTPIVVRGKWTGPVIANNMVSGADGFVPAGTAVIQLAFPTGGATADAPSNPSVIGNLRGNNYNGAIVGTSNVISQHLQSSLIGVTATGPFQLTTATTLNASQTGQLFVNTTATAIVAVTLPAAENTSRQVYEFYVTDADGFNIIGPASGLRIGSGALGTSMSATAVGAWARLTRVSSTLWIAEVDATANWTVI